MPQQQSSPDTAGAASPARVVAAGRATRELLVVEQLLGTRLAQALRPLGLSRTQFSVLSHLQRAGEQTIGDVARAMEVNQPAVSKVLAALAAAGAVALRSADLDRRVRMVQITPDGKALLEDAQRAATPEVLLAFEGVDDRELDALATTLARIAKHLDRVRS